jgi:hypothetical protein
MIADEHGDVMQNDRDPHDTLYIFRGSFAGKDRFGIVKHIQGMLPAVFSRTRERLQPFLLAPGSRFF